MTALGRAIAAFLPPGERAPLTTGLEPRFLQILSDVEANGFATEDGDEVDGVGCVAAARRRCQGSDRRQHRHHQILQ